MTDACMNLRDPEGLLEAMRPVFGAWARRRAVAELQRATGAAERTVWAWRRGELPKSRHMAALARVWGEPFLREVFAPALDGPETIDARLRRVEAEHAAIRASLREGAHVTDDLVVARKRADGRGRGADAAGAAGRGALAAVGRGAALTLFGLALGVAVAQGGGYLDAGDDGPVMRIQRPRGGGAPRRAPVPRARAREV